MARICLDEGDVEGALELIELVRSAHESLETAGAIGSRLTEVDAEIALAAGDEDRARQLFTKSIAAYGAYPELWSEAEFRFRWSLQLRSHGDPAGADEQLGAVRPDLLAYGRRPALDRPFGAGWCIVTLEEVGHQGLHHELLTLLRSLEEAPARYAAVGFSRTSATPCPDPPHTPSAA